MLDTLLTLFKGNHQTFLSFVQTMYNLVQHFEANYVDEGSRNAAIDAAVELLQSYKTKV